MWVHRMTYHEMTCPLAVKMGPIEGRMEQAKVRYCLIVVARLRICKPFFLCIWSTKRGHGPRHSQWRPWKLGIGSRFYLQHINAMHYAPINVMPAGGGGRAWGGDLIVFVVPMVGHLTDLVLLGEGIFESFFAQRGDI